MQRIACALGLAGVLLLLSRPVGAFGEIEDAQKAILDIAKDLEAGKDVKAKVDAIRKKVELEHIMQAYKPKAKKGIGVGEMGEGIEVKLNNMGRRNVPAGVVTKEKDELIKMAYVNLAISRLSKEYPGKKGSKGPKDWNAHLDNMDKATMEFIKAVKAGDAGKLKGIATNINASCNDCHSEFRD